MDVSNLLAKDSGLFWRRLVSSLLAKANAFFARRLVSSLPAKDSALFSRRLVSSLLAKDSALFAQRLLAKANCFFARRLESSLPAKDNGLFAAGFKQCLSLTVTVFMFITDTISFQETNSWMCWWSSSTETFQVQIARSGLLGVQRWKR